MKTFRNVVHLIVWVNYSFKTLTTGLIATVGHKTKEQLSLNIFIF